MAYKFQLGAARLSGSLVQEGQIKAEAAALSGSSLSIGGTAVTATPAELNILASSGLVAADMTTLAGLALDGVGGLVQADFTKLAAVTSTSAELNIVDGGTTVGTGLLLDSHGFVHNSGSTMVQTQIVKIIEHGFAKISGDATVASGGALTIGAGTIEGSMLDANVAGDGVTVVSNAIKLNLNASGGLDVSGPGGQAGIKLGTNPGLQLAPGGLTAKVKTDAGLTLDGDGLSVNTLDLAGDGLGENSGVLQVNVHSSGGLDLNGPDRAVQIKLDTNPGLALGSGGIKVAAAQVGITSIINSSIGKIGTAANQEYIDFGSANEIKMSVNDTAQLTVGNGNVVISGDLIVQGSSVEIQQGFVVTSSVAFEGSTPDGNEVILTAADAQGSDKTITLPDLTGHVPLLAGAVGNANVTSAEFLLLDGGSTVETATVVDGDAVLFNDADDTMKQINVTSLKTYFQTGVTADSAAKIKRTVNVSTGANMTISDDSMVDLFNITASATALIASSGFSAGDEINIKAGPLVSEAVVLTISGAAPSGYTFDGYPSIQLESPNASIKLILEGTNNWMIF
jgi:hypothetical protein